MNWYFEAWKKYAVFGGRSGRQEYWYFVLFHVLAYILLSIIAGVLGKAGASLLSFYAAAAFIPGLAATMSTRASSTGSSKLAISPTPDLNAGNCSWY